MDDLSQQTSQKSQHVLPLQEESFVLLVNQLKKHIDAADIFEIWLDKMRVKGDLAVIQKFFKKPMMGKSENLEMLKRAAKAGMHYVDVPHNLQTDPEFDSLVKNKGVQVVRSFHDFAGTPSMRILQEVLDEMDSSGAHILKIATHVSTPEDTALLMRLLELPKYKGRLVVTGMGELARELRIHAPLKGSLFYYAPVAGIKPSASGQISKDELEREWSLL